MEPLWEILTSWEHWAFELISGAVFAVPAYGFGRWRVRVHDRKKHGVE
jgi:hypothetical protein